MIVGYPLREPSGNPENAAEAEPEMLITFEGIDGCGKSTQASLLRDHLERKGGKVVLTHEPGGGGEIGLSIRNLILLEEMKDADPLAELFLFCADRVHHVEKVVKPVLNEGKTVISDRFFDSTVAYQGYGRGIDLEFATAAARRSALGIKPDITFLLNVPCEICMERLKKRKDGKNSANRMDREARTFYNRLSTGFMAEAEKEPERIKIIDAKGSVGETHGLITAIVDGRREI